MKIASKTKMTNSRRTSSSSV